MDDRYDTGQRKSRTSMVGWILGGLLILAVAAFALNGSFAGIDRDGSSNSDVRPAQG